MRLSSSVLAILLLATILTPEAAGQTLNYWKPLNTQHSSLCAAYFSCSDFDSTSIHQDSTKHLWYNDTYRNTMMRLVSKKQPPAMTDSIPNNVFFLVEGFDGTNKNTPVFYWNKAKTFFDTVTDTTNNTDVYILNFKEGGNDMYHSTSRVFDAIKFINDTHRPPKMIVAGMSMGAVLARMALMNEVVIRRDTATTTCPPDDPENCVPFIVEIKSNLSDVPVSHYVSMDGPHRKATIDTMFMNFIADPGRYITGNWVADWIISPKARGLIKPQQASLKSIAGRQLLANNPYYNDPALDSFINPYWETLMDSSGNQIMPTIPDTTIAVSFANWDPMKINGSVAWLEVVIKWGLVLNRGDLTVSKNDDWGQPGSQFPRSFTTHDLLRNYPEFPERRPTFIPTKSALARDQSDPPVFDIEILSDIRGSHDELPENISQKLLYETNMIYPTHGSIITLEHPSGTDRSGLLSLKASATGGTGTGYVFEWSTMQLCDESETDPPPPGISIPTCNTWHFAGTGEHISFTKPQYGPLQVRLTTKDKRLSHDERYFSYAHTPLIEWPANDPDRGRGKTLSINNYPNPFNPTTEINLNVPETMHVSVNVYDLLGRKVSTVIDSKLAPGKHIITFDGSFLATGTYFYVLNTDRGDRITRRLLLLK